jgi:hypothetical protein
MSLLTFKKQKLRGIDNIDNISSEVMYVIFW